MSAAPKVPYVSLNEVVTARAFGEARTAGQELTRRLTSQHELRDLIIRRQGDRPCLPVRAGQSD